MSNYFNKFPNTTYELNKKKSVVKDIFRRVAFMSEYKPYSDLYTDYLIKDGETPQFLANAFYGDPAYYWIILVFNELHNIHTDWPMTQLGLERWCGEYYGNDLYQVAYYEIEGNIVGEYKEYVPGNTWTPPSNPFPDNLTCVPVTFFEHENNRNDAKRNIKIMRAELVRDFIKQFESAINV